MRRNLAAVLAADVVGYSRLMGDDAEGTLSAPRRLGQWSLIGPVGRSARRLSISPASRWSTVVSGTGIDPRCAAASADD